VPDPLEDLRVTAQRVQRFADDVERDGSPESRGRWREALRDLRHRIRHARAAGHDTAEIQEATGNVPASRFTPAHGGAAEQRDRRSAAA
jgi:hypothetical protein